MIRCNPPPEPLPEDLVRQAADFSTSLFCDAQLGFGAMDHRIKPVAPGTKVVGSAFTVNLKAGSGTAVIAAVALAGKGHVLVISGKASTENAVLGDLLAHTAIRSGVEGIVLDGVVRDIEELRTSGLPIFALGANPGAAAKEGPGELNTTVSCGGVGVNPGDLVIGDDDGVVVIPRGRLDEALKAASAKDAFEKRRRKEIASGLLMPEWLNALLVNAQG